jgi:hypothetical protein
VEYDTVTNEEIGIILKSGVTEFYTNVEDDNPENDGSSLFDLDLGQEEWFGELPVTIEQFQAKLTQWDDLNRAPDSGIIVAPFRLTNDTGTLFLGNMHNASGYLTQTTWLEDESNDYMLQFKAWWLLEKIFEHYGYTVTVDELKTGDFTGLTILTRPFAVTASAVDPEVYPEAALNDRMIFPSVDNLIYKQLMPEVKTIDFLNEMKTLMGLSYDIDDLNKKVKIIQLKSIIAGTEEATELQELSGWQHKEGKITPADGYSLAYQTQADPLDNRSDYIVEIVYANDESEFENLEVDDVFSVTSLARDYLVTRPDVAISFKQIGRLKPKVSGKQKTAIEFNVMVPQSVYGNDLKEVTGGPLFTGPLLKLSSTITTGEYYEMGATLLPMPAIYVSIYRGMITNLLITTIPFQTVPIPFLSADRWILSETVYLSPERIYELVYAEYLSWKTAGAREFTKFIQMTLPELLALEWGKRYFVNGVKVVLSKINYELPFTGIVQVEGYVV